MEIINGVDRLPPQDRPMHLALGNFDGVHRGHQVIIRKVVEESRRNKGVSAAFIFNPHPVVALDPDNPLVLLTDIEDRAEIMADLGLDYLIIEQFTKELAVFTPEYFIKTVLFEELKVKEIFVGENYRFGCRGSGSAATLHYWSKKLGFEVHVVPMFYHKGKEVSSSFIRSLLLTGAVKEAADFLNYYFYRQSTVVRGLGIGKKLVYPTANILINTRLLWPGPGVYLTAIGKISKGLLYGVTNVGPRPTFNEYDRAVETHIIDFEDNLYNRFVRLCFLEKLRCTMTFSSPRQLKEQIDKDIAKSRILINDYKQEKNGRGNSLQAGCSVLRS